MLKLNITDNIKAAVIKVLIDLIVDRDPQAETKIPCLTRTWTDIESCEHPQLPYVEPSRRYTFGLVQQIVADHIKSMIGTRWTELSLNMLKLLNRLTRFNFYGTEERLQDVISGLISALDRRKVDIETLDKGKKSKRRVSMKVKEGAQDKPEVDISSKYSINNVNEENTVVTATGESAAVAIVEEEQDSWQEILLTYMETLQWMLIVLSLVLVAVSVTIYQSLATNQSQDEVLYLF
jgi:hypothetical protein